MHRKAEIIMNFNEKALELAVGEARNIFCTLLPESGLSVRKEQLALCEQMLFALFNNKIALCDAGVGIGKTYAYLVACILYANYLHSQKTNPVITISTSGVALQTAITTEYIPFLSRVLLENNIIQKPIRAVIRKGKERFVCDYLLKVRLEAVRDKPKNDVQRKALQALKYHFDLDKAVGLSGFDRRQVSVPKYCSKSCSLQTLCRYHRYLQLAQNPNILFQICNHNYLLADAEHRLKDFTPLLQDYQMLVIDEAHKLTEAAGQMYGSEIGESEWNELCCLLEQEHFTYAAQFLREDFRQLIAALSQGNQPEASRTKFTATTQIEKALHQVLRRLRRAGSSLLLPQWILYRLEEKEKTLSLFYTGNCRHILYLSYDKQGIPSLCCALRSDAQKLKKALWEQDFPIIQTSGTLMAGGSFQRTRRVLGLSESGRVKEFAVFSPFDYKENCLLYIPKNSGNFQKGSAEEAVALAEHIQELVQATHGHTLVLFTSYSLMGSVYKVLKDTLSFPLLEVWRNSQEVIGQFKQLPNAVLFAAGSCWEGIDFPGDMVSSLIITRLPFPVPDPVSEAEREQFATLEDYIKAVVIPDMQKKLRQGFGRAIRTETDTCVVSILDHRAAGKYHSEVLNALPECAHATEIHEVEQFIKRKKSKEYFWQEKSDNGES